MQVLVVGAGGHAQVVADCLLRMAEVGSRYQPVGFVDDDERLQGTEVLGLPVLGPLAAIDSLDHDAIFVGIGNNALRQRIAMKLQAKGNVLVTAVHPQAIVAPSVTIGPGTLIAAGAVISTGAKLGANVIINTAATVDHCSSVGDYAHIAPGSHLGGDVQIGDGALIGIGAIVMPQQQVGQWATIGAGALVNCAVSERTTVIGVPARPFVRRQ